MTNGTPPLPYLALLRDHKPFQVFNLNKDVITIGRATSNDIVLMDRRISRNHARLMLQEGRWVIEDLGSDNGVWVNGIRISKPTVVADDSIISLGQAVQFEMELKPDMPAGVSKRKVLPKWMLPAGILGVGGLVALGVLIVAVIGYFIFFPPGGEPLVSVDLGGEQPAADLTDPQAIEAALTEGIVSNGGPRVTFQEPIPGTQVPLNGSIVVQTTALDEDGVVRIDLWVDDQLAITQTSPDEKGLSPFILTHGMEGTELGTYALVARAFDSTGAMGESPAIYITVSDKITAQPIDEANQVELNGETVSVVNHVVQDDEPTLDLVAMHTTIDVNDLQILNPGVFGELDPGQNIALPNKPAGDQNVPPPPTAGQLMGLNPLFPTLQDEMEMQLQQNPFSGMVLKQLLPAPQNLPQKPLPLLPSPSGLTAKAVGCKVELNWKVNSTNEQAIAVYRRRQPDQINMQLIKVLPAKTSAYIDEGVFPGTYEYVIEAIGELKMMPQDQLTLPNVSMFMENGRSAPKTVTVITSPDCFDDPDKTRMIYFQPLRFTPHEPETLKAAIWYGILGGFTSRRIPPGQGTFHPLGDWSKIVKPEAQPVSPSLIQNENQAFFVATWAEGETWDTFYGRKPPTDLGTGFLSVTPREVVKDPNRVYEIFGGHFALQFKMWFDDMKWTGKGWSTNPAANNKIPAPYDLAFDTSPEGKVKTRAIKWKWKGDPSTIDGFIIYRSYNCGGGKRIVWYPEVHAVHHRPLTENDMKFIWRENDEPAGCASRIQVSAFGRYGESALSNALYRTTLNGYLKASVTFIDLKIDKPVNGSTAGEFIIYANNHRLNASDWIRQGSYKLEKMVFDGIQPHNTVELELAYGYEPLYVGFEIYAVDQNNVRKSNYCGTFDLIRTTELENIGPAGVTRTKSQGPCTLTYKVNGQPVQQLDEGTYVTKQADMEVVRVGRVGTQVYAMINNRGPDNLITEPVRLITDWAIKCEDQKPIESSYIFSELRYVGSIMPQWVYIYRGVDDLYTYVNTQTGKDDLKTQGKNCYYELRVEVDPSVPGEPSERFYTDPNNSNNKVKIDLAKIEPMK